MIQPPGTADLAPIRKYLVCHVRPDRINEADIFASPGLGGDGAFEFIDTFSADFAVDMAAYDWALYHHDETEMLLTQWLARILYRLQRNRPDPDRAFLRVSLLHLGNVTATGRWYVPPGRLRARPWPALWRSALQWLNIDSQGAA